MSFNPLGAGISDGYAKLDGKEFKVTWSCWVPRLQDPTTGRSRENTPYKNLVEKICCTAATRDYKLPGVKHNEITIRSLVHSTTRVGGSRSINFSPDDPHITVNYGPAPKLRAAHVYVGPVSPELITVPSDYNSVDIWRKGGQPPILWWDRN